jgi:peptidoglycan-associated lipoprotein
MRHFRAVAILSLAGLAAACSTANPKNPAPSAAHGVAAEAAIHGHQFGAVAELKTVNFEYDVDRLTDDGRRILKENAAAIKRNPGWEVLVEGHCDQRGTIEYNLALGQRRAKAVRDYYVLLGIPGGRLATLSYGAEKNACSDSTESCWAVNRRAESKVKTTIAAKPR